MVQIVQCPAVGAADGVDVAADDCLYAYGKKLTTSDEGRFEARVTVYAKFQRSNNELIDCRREPAACAIAVPWPRRESHRMARVTLGSVSP